MEIARADKDYDKMDLIGKAIQRLEDDIKLHKVRSDEMERIEYLQLGGVEVTDKRGELIEFGSMGMKIIEF